MLIDFNEHPEAADIESDVCIVGAGAAGIPLARRLAERGRSVCLLESGGLEYERATQDLFQGENVGMEYYDLDQSRLRFFGGTTRIWGGRCAMLDPIDFERRPWVPHSGWPIDRTDLNEHYRQAHQQFELGEFNYEQDIWKALGVDDPRFDPEKVSTCLWRFDPVAERYGPTSCADVIESPHIRVLLHTNAVHLQADDHANSIDHIVVCNLAGTTAKVRARSYVLATGAIENARLLLNSDDIETNGVGNGQDQVGRYFMEHPYGRIAEITSEKPFELWAWMQKRFPADSPPLAPVLRLGEAAQRDLGSLNGAVTLKLQRPPNILPGARIYPTLKHAMAPNKTGLALNNIYRSLRAWIHREVRMTVERSLCRLGYRHLYMIMRGEQSPNPDSRVRLSQQRDALGIRQADLDWQMSALDKKAASDFVDVMDDELQRLDLGELIPGEWLSDPSPQWPVDPTIGNHFIGGYHHMGTTRMSSDPSHGVVDADCRVHGYGNLFVAGSSVFATSGWANPTLTIVALSLRLADHLDNRLRTPD